MLLSLLRSRNRALERMLALAEELLSLPSERLESSLQPFETGREACLRAMHAIDRKISETIASMDEKSRTDELISEIKKLEALREEKTRQILARDKMILERIDSAQKDLEKQIGASRKNKQVLGKFKSTWVPNPGEGLDTTL